VGEARRDQHHLGADPLPGGAVLEHHLPVEGMASGGGQYGPGARQDRGTNGLSCFHQGLIQAGPRQNPTRAQGDRAHQTSHPQLQRAQGQTTLICH
jgi:hypothetical protein